MSLLCFLLVGSQHNYSQQFPKGPPAPAKPVRTVGEAKVYYFENQNLTIAQVYLYIQGEVLDIYKKKDVLVMQVGYKVTGQKATAPKFLDFDFISYSADMPKYKGDHKVSMYLNDLLLFSGETTPRYLYYPPGKVSSEMYSSSDFTYTNYQQLIKAQKVTMQIGKTKIDLMPGTIQALRDLNQTIER